MSTAGNKPLIQQVYADAANRSGTTGGWRQRSGSAAMAFAHSAFDLRQTITSGKPASSFKGCWRAFQAWRERERMRSELYSFSDRELSDIGITRGEIEYFVSNRTIDLRGIRPSSDECLISDTD